MDPVIANDIALHKRTVVRIAGIQLNAVSGIAVDVVAIDEIVAGADVESVMKVARAVVVDFVVDELVVIDIVTATRIAGNQDAHSIGGILDLGVLQSNMTRGSHR